MSLRLAPQQKARLKCSGLDFEITDTTQPSVTVIRFRHEWQQHTIRDEDLRNAADDINEWGGKTSE